MRYALYYDYETIGDVLLIDIKPNIVPSKVVRSGNVVSLYKNDEIIGINIFDISKIIKIKAKGLIPLIDKKILDVINHILKNASINELPYNEESGFRVAKILSLEEHPDSEHLHICTVDIGEEKPLQIVCGAANAREGLKCVCATPFTFMPNGNQIIPSALLGVESNGMLCSGRELNLEGYEGKRGLLELDESYKIGDDFRKL